MKELKIKDTTQVALVDDEDYDRLKDYTWQLSGKNKTTVCRQVHISNITKNVALTKDVMRQYAVVFDHIDRNIFNNSKCNLRVCTLAENNQNRGKTKFKTSSRFKGPTLIRSAQKWQVQVMANKKLHYLGRFNSEIDAAIAYNIAVRQLHGEFAALNPIPTVFSY